MNRRQFLLSAGMSLAMLSVFSPSLLARQAKGEISGKVISRDTDKPVVDATVVARNNGTGKEVEVSTGADGKFRFTGLRAGTYLIGVQAAGFESRRLNTMITLAADEVVTLKDAIKLLTEQAVSVIRGAVFTEQGLSLALAKVVIERIGADGKSTAGKVGEYMTNTAGEFSFRLPGRNALYRVTASADGYRPTSKDIDVQKNERRNIALTLVSKDKPEKPEPEKPKE
ncbi:MAG TPA: carboxypeptidase-like regulatory domain-containing protein [Acidobacteriota bacterium]|nr:carboxypeptidase-like regulatory domain-containing protein [Acidobacteriota bacterium]HNB72583.1 carboxypeptidase-like regulatory domain-containing protein [Acidobacteriota bacterium]